MDLYELQTLVESFKNEIINDTETVNHKCFCISYPLSLYIEIKGYTNTTLIEGNFKRSVNNPNLPCPKKHYWIVLNNEIIIDATIEQFSDCLPEKRLPIIFLSNKFNENKYDSTVKEHKEWFEADSDNKSMEKSLDGFMSGFTILLDTHLGEENIREIGFDIRDLLRITIKAAIIINKEIDRKKIEINKKYLRYFNFINDLLVEASKNKELSQVKSEFKNNEDYQYLISKLNTMQL